MNDTAVIIARCSRQKTMFVYWFDFYYRNNFLIIIVKWWLVFIFVLNAFFKEMSQLVTRVTTLVFILFIERFSIWRFIELSLSCVNFHWLKFIIKLTIFFVFLLFIQHYWMMFILFQTSFILSIIYNHWFDDYFK